MINFWLGIITRKRLPNNSHSSRLGPNGSGGEAQSVVLMVNFVKNGNGSVSFDKNKLK
jgi:hypothetical protein